MDPVRKRASSKKLLYLKIVRKPIPFRIDKIMLGILAAILVKNIRVIRRYLTLIPSSRHMPR